MKILILGSGGREHALAWKLAQSPQVDSLVIAPGNAGTAEFGRNVPVDLTDLEAVVALATAERPDLTLVGPASLFVAGIVDRFTQLGLQVVGPERRVSGLFASRGQAKTFMERHHVPTSPFKIVQSAEEAVQVIIPLLPSAGVILKIDDQHGPGSVCVPDSIDDAQDFLKAAFAQGATRLVVETRMRGRELGIPLLTDGDSWLMLPWVRRLTRLRDGDKGALTEGTGAYAPAGRRDEDADTILRDVIIPIVTGLQAEGLGYRGFMQINLMFTLAGPQVLSLHPTLGPIETQVMMPVISDDLVRFLDVTMAGRLDEVELTEPDQLALGVHLATPGYPSLFEPTPVTGLEALAARSDTLLFYDTLAPDGAGDWQAAGRALTRVGLALTRLEAKTVAYDGLDAVRMGDQSPVFRTDVGHIP